MYVFRRMFRISYYVKRFTNEEVIERAGATRALVYEITMRQQRSLDTWWEKRESGALRNDRGN